MSNNDLFCDKCKSQHHPVECPKDEEPMTPENQRDEDLKKAEELLPFHAMKICTGKGGKTVIDDEQYEEKSLCNQEIERSRVILAKALTAQRQSWEREKKELEAEVKRRILCYCGDVDALNNKLNRLKSCNEELEKKLEYFQSFADQNHTLAEKVTLENESLKAELHEATLRASEYKNEWESALYREQGLKAENERLAKNAEDNQKLCQEKHNLMVSKRSKWASQRETIHRLTSALARAHEALEQASEAMKYYSHSGVKAVSDALSDKDGTLALERWKRMEAVVEAGMKVEKYLMWINVYDAHIKECFDEKVRDSWRKVGGLTDEVFRAIKDFREALEAFDASEGGV